MDKIIHNICIGIDPSLTCTGLVVINGGVVSLKSIKPDGDNIFTKCDQIKRAIMDNIMDIVMDTELYQNGDYCIAIETPFSGKNMATAAKLAGLGYTIREMIFNNYDKPFTDVSPSQVKKFIGAKKKDEIMMQVLKRYKVETANSDEADAFVLAKIAECYIDPAKCENDKQREVIAKLKG